MSSCGMNQYRVSWIRWVLWWFPPHVVTTPAYLLIKADTWEDAYDQALHYIDTIGVQCFRILRVAQIDPPPPTMPCAPPTA